MRRMTIERAYELARSGEYANPTQICARLRVEGYYDAQMQLQGTAIRKSLLNACRRSRGWTASPDARKAVLGVA
jgi:hypothetical protein